MSEPDFLAYLQSICDTEKYRRWWSLYTVTDVEGKIRGETEFSPFDFGLMVEAVLPKKRDELNEKLRKNEPKEKIERLPVLEGLRKYAQNTVLLVGRPGSGKSTALARLLLEEALQMTAKNAIAPLPVLVELRQHRTSILDLIREVLVRHGLRWERREIEQMLAQGRFLLLLDGINELPNDEARRDLKAFRENYCHVPAIFTTRDLGVGGDFGIEKRLEMQPLNATQMQQFVRAYLPEQGEEMLGRLGEKLREFGQTPLLLWMLCELFKQTGEIPPNLGLVFRCFAQSFERKIKEDVAVAAESRRWWGELLQHLAFAMMQGEAPTEFRVAIARRDVESLFAEFLKDKVAYSPTRAKEFLEDLLEHHLLQLTGNEQIEFRHQLLQEYYAAEALLGQVAKMSDAQLKKTFDAQLKRDYLNYLKWTEPIALMLALLEKEAQAVRVVRLALEVDLMLGARLAGEVKREFQEKTVELVEQLEVREPLKVWFLGRTRSEFAVELVCDRLQDRVFNVRKAVTEALQNISNEATVFKSLISALQRKYLYLCDINAKPFLEKVGYRVAIKAIISALQHENSLYSIPFLQHLTTLDDDTPDAGKGRRGGSFVARFVENGITREEAEILASIMFFRKSCFHTNKTLPKVESMEIDTGNNAAVNALISALQDKDKDLLVRRTAAAVLGKIGNEAAVNPLITALQDEDSSVRWAAARALGKIGNEAAVNSLITALQDEDSDVRWAAAFTLGEIGNEAAVNSLITALQDEDSSVRWAAAFTLGKIGNEAAVNSLITALQDEDSDVRLAAAFTLGEIGNEAAVNSLITALQDEDSDVRREAARALGKIGNEAAVNSLITDLQDEDSDVRREAAGALEEIAPDRVLPQMWDLLLTGKYDTTGIILKIQERCQFYNYSLFHSPPIEEVKTPSPEPSAVQMNFYAPVTGAAGNVEGNFINQNLNENDEKIND